MEDGPELLKQNVEYIGGLSNNPIQAVAAYSQTNLTNRFQSYYEGDWFAYTRENGGYAKTNLLDFGLVKEMKVAMHIGLFDNTCPLTFSMKAIQSMGPDVVAQVLVAPWQGHCSWAWSESQWFMDKLNEALTLNQD